jgi:type IV pilus assembly protein PilA
LSALGGKPGEATPEAAQIIDEHLSSGKKSGYRFTISDCKKGVVDGRSVYTNYRVTAVPDSGAGSGAKGFCTDENGVISFDPNGGNNCKEIVQ